MALVPMKDLGDAKQRLSPILSENERMGLVYAMLRDVLSALSSSDNIASVSIVAHDRGYLDFGVDFIEEAVNCGYNEAIRFALRKSILAESAAILVIPGDIPLATSTDINALTTRVSQPTVRIASSRDGDGTNGLMISPPKLMETSFGIGSFVRHQKIATSTGALVETITGHGIAFDIDTPEDLIAFCAIDETSETHTFLDLSGIRRRLLAEKI